MYSAKLPLTCSHAFTHSEQRDARRERMTGREEGRTCASKWWLEGYLWVMDGRWSGAAHCHMRSLSPLCVFDGQIEIRSLGRRMVDGKAKKKVRGWVAIRGLPATSQHLCRFLMRPGGTLCRWDLMDLQPHGRGTSHCNPQLLLFIVASATDCPICPHFPRIPCDVPIFPNSSCLFLPPIVIISVSFFSQDCSIDLSFRHAGWSEDEWCPHDGKLKFTTESVLSTRMWQ